MRILKWTALAVIAVVVLALGLIYSGLYDVAADNPHSRWTHRLIETTREHSIRAAARKVGLPPLLDDPAFIAMGAREYDEMCTGCHLAPGMDETELRAGLYPKPPELARPAFARTPAETFWIIKHGLKMTGMPAWGVTHDDRRLWSLVAFLLKLPQLSPQAYHELAEAAGEDHHHGSHERSHADEHDAHSR